MPKSYKDSKELYIYPAVFSYDDDGVSVEFPDLPGCLSCGDDDTEAVYNAKEALALHLYGMEEDGEEIPNPTDISKINAEKNQRIFAIDVWMPYYRANIKEYYVKKTLTIPNSLNIIAQRNNVNFSEVLKNALIEYLGLRHDTSKR